MSRRWARRVERYCCSCLTYFPLAFVYGLTSWAVWVVVSIGSFPAPEGRRESWTGKCGPHHLPLFIYFVHVWVLLLGFVFLRGSSLNKRATRDGDEDDVDDDGQQ